MTDSSWPQPPIFWEDLPKVLGLLGHDANRHLRRWVLVPASWLDAQSGPSSRRRSGLTVEGS